MAVAAAKLAIAPDGEDAAIVSGLPDPCAVTVNGVEQSVMGGSLILRSRAPGLFDLTFRAWPFLDARLTIEAA